MKTEKIYTQHEENKEWMNNVSFFHDEIKVMEHRLQEIAKKNTAKEVLAQVEHFQNQFNIQKNHLDELKHEINLSEDRIAAEIKKNATAIEHRSTGDHSTARNNMESFERIYTPLKADFNTFLSKWM